MIKKFFIAALLVLIGYALAIWQPVPENDQQKVKQTVARAISSVQSWLSVTWNSLQADTDNIANNVQIEASAIENNTTETSTLEQGAKKASQNLQDKADNEIASLPSSFDTHERTQATADIVVNTADTLSNVSKTNNSSLLTAPATSLNTSVQGGTSYRSDTTNTNNAESDFAVLAQSTFAKRLSARAAAMSEDGSIKNEARDFSNQTSEASASEGEQAELITQSDLLLTPETKNAEMTLVLGKFADEDTANKAIADLGLTRIKAQVFPFKSPTGKTSSLVVLGQFSDAGKAHSEQLRLESLHDLSLYVAKFPVKAEPEADNKAQLVQSILAVIADSESAGNSEKPKATNSQPSDNK